MSWVDTIKDTLPEYAKDTKLNLDAVLLRSSLDPVVAHGCAVAAAMATGNGKLLNFIEQGMEEPITSSTYSVTKDTKEKRLSTNSLNKWEDVFQSWKETRLPLSVPLS